MEVYIVFGDNARTDGDNIHGIFFTRQRAEEFMIEEQEWLVDTVLHIEKHYIEE